ncbi:MAG TPA: histidine kinase, partial [Ktedonobacterales bacterium]|nr:histidine kinase [Ktedonobacterales bacterium]
MPAPQQQIEPRLLTVFRAFIWALWALLSLGVCGSLSRHGGVPDFASLLGWPVVTSLLLYLYAGFLRRMLGRAYLPLALLVASAGPCVVVALSAALRVRSGLRGAAAGTDASSLFVVLLLPLLLISVQYGFRELLAFTLGTSLLSVVLAVPVAQVGGPSLVSVTQGAAARLVFFTIAGALVMPVSRAQRKLREEQTLKNAQLSDYAMTLEQLAVTRERNRIAREMHDTLAHTLSAVSVQLEALDVLWDRDPAAARRALGEMRETTRGGLDEARRALHALRAAPVEELGLVLALRRLGEAAAERGGMRLECDLPPRVSGL